MYEGQLIYTFTGDTKSGEHTHGGAGMVYWGNIPDADCKLLAKSASIKLGDENVAPPSSVFLSTNENLLKKNTFDIKFYGPDGEQSSFDGSGIFAASRAAQKKFNIENGSIITLLPDQEFSDNSAPARAHVKVDIGIYGPMASFIMQPAGITKLDITDPRYEILSKHISGLKGDIYKTSLDDLIYLAETSDSLRTNTISPKLLKELSEVDSSMYGVVGVASGKKQNDFEMQLSSQAYEGSEAGCVTTGAEVIPFLEMLGLLKKSGKDYTDYISLSSPHKRKDGRELGSTMQVARNQNNKNILSVMNVSDGGIFYFDKQPNGTLKQYSFAEIASQRLVNSFSK
ncbi:MAG: hypothetical protein LBU68_01970 [Rickettsiales bacterium]|jgi:hypothetical protein|nr:hypothetical protein [Rickettsiales bacterium]